MTESPQPTAGSLEARIIRACTHHADSTCSLQCKYRQVEDLGEIASFSVQDHPRDSSHDPSIVARLKDAYFKWHGGQKKA